MKAILIGLCTFCILGGNAQDRDLKLNQIQIIASHNSYKKRPPAQEMKFLMKVRNKLGKENDPVALDYGHLPFDSQFTYYNIRGLEIDIYHDPKGGHFYKRKVNAFVRGLKTRSKVSELKKPGFKVLHIADIDYETHYYTFREALSAIKEWSDAHPNHLPLFINIESKTDAPGDMNGFLRFFGFRRAPKFDEAACDSIDAEIESVFGSDLRNVITPDRARGNFQSLDEMAAKNGWPLLSDCRGKVLFIMEGGAVNTYIANHPSLKGRTMFVYSEPGRPEAAFVKRNESTRDKEEIKELVRKGYIIRSRADTETWQARNNDYSAMNNSFESGAHITSTDYYLPDLRLSTFQVRFPDGEAGRKNPVNSDGGALEE